MDWSKLGAVAGPLALAAFAGTLLGGIALSFFWKTFGPWKILSEVQVELRKCDDEREEMKKFRAANDALIADLRARYEMLAQAVSQAGLGLQLGKLEH